MAGRAVGTAAAAAAAAGAAAGSWLAGLAAGLLDGEVMLATWRLAQRRGCGKTKAGYGSRSSAEASAPLKPGEGSPAPPVKRLAPCTFYPPLALCVCVCIYVCVRARVRDGSNPSSGASVDPEELDMPATQGNGISSLREGEALEGERYG